MKKIAFIPARGGSKSIPLKNIKLFCGKPLIYWVTLAAFKTKEIDEIVVATDSIEIKNTVNNFNFNKVKVYWREKENSQDFSTTESVVLEYISKTKLTPKDCFILIQATSPLLTEIDIVNGLNLFKKHDSVLSCVKSKRFFWSKDGTPINYKPKNRPRRQDFDGFFMENGAFYISSIEKIISSKNRISGNIGISQMPDYTDIEIDEPHDWIIAENLMQNFILNKKDLLLKKKNIKLVVSDVDGVLTDAGMYYSESGEELKKFNTQDGMGFELLRKNKIKTAIVTSEDTKIVYNRSKKLKVDFLYQGKKNNGKLKSVMSICEKLNINLDETAYIGDDINCIELLSNVGIAACPSNATKKVKSISNINVLNNKGGEGVFREFAELILSNLTL